jgi:hypothetical protein
MAAPVHHFTVGDFIEALQRYDRDRIVAVGTAVVKGIVSIEPGGAVMFDVDRDSRIDPITAEVTSDRRPKSLADLLGMPQPEDD